MALFSKSDTVDVGVVFRLVSSQAIHKKYANPNRHPRPIVRRFHWSFFEIDMQSKEPADETADPFGFNTCWDALKLLF